MIKKFINLIFYCFLLVLGFIMSFWIIYARFIRERLPKDIPIKLSEFGFWFLSYICIIYIIMIISLLFLTTKKPNETLIKIRDLIFTPLVEIDHFFKYNQFMKKPYYIFMDNLIFILQKLNHTELLLLNIYFQILPRMLLVYLLFKDAFIFCKLEILYKFVLIGLLPFIHRYIKYSIKDIKEQYIKDMEVTCEGAHLFDEAYADPNIDWEHTEDNKYHRRNVPLKEFIEFRIKQEVYKTPDVSYDFYWLIKTSVYEKYQKLHNIPLDTVLNKENRNIINKHYYMRYEECLTLGKFSKIYSIIGQMKIIVYFKIFIFAMYLICWGYILYVSYFTYPINFINTKLVIQFILRRMLKFEEPFSGIIL
jgi:hypothetical protein